MKLTLTRMELFGAISQYLNNRGFKLLNCMIIAETAEAECTVEELPKPPAETLERAAVTMMTEYDNNQKAKP